MKKIVLLNNENDFYRRIYYLKIISFFGVKIYVEYNNKLYSSSKEKHPEEINVVLKILDILNVKKKLDKYNLIYDYTCDYLDNEFKINNWCNFKNDVCICNRNKNKECRVESCCVRNKTKIVCKYFDNKNKKCSIKCISCKLFTCKYLKSKGIKYSTNKIPYLKYFLSIRQKKITNYSIIEPKYKIIEKWRKFYYW